MNTDKIEKKILLRAPLSRVWDAIADSKQFGTWFGMKVDQPWAAGQIMRVAITPTKMNEEVAKKQAPMEGHAFDILIEAIEPQSRFAFRWHVSAEVPGADFHSQPSTLVEFRLEPAEGGVLLTITESGFDQVPMPARVEAFKRNEGGWAIQTTLIEAYLSKHADAQNS